MSYCFTIPSDQNKICEVIYSIQFNVPKEIEDEYTKLDFMQTHKPEEFNAGMKVRMSELNKLKFNKKFILKSLEFFDKNKRGNDYLGYCISAQVLFDINNEINNLKLEINSQTFTLKEKFENE